jgi:hypothetical protein
LIAREHAMQQALIERAARNVRSGQIRGQIPADIDDRLAGAAIIGAVRTAMATAMRMSPRPSPRRVTSQLWALIMSAVGLSPEGE